MVAESTTSDTSGISINMSSQSSPRLYICGMTPVNGTTIGEGVNESAEAALTDGNPNTAIMGNATFDVSLTGQNESSFINNPGPELGVIELHGAERFEVSVGNESISGRATPTNSTNGCDYIINQALIDLSSLGVPNGSSVSSVRFNNLGVTDSLDGADIAEISVFTPQANGSSTKNLTAGFFQR